MATHLLTIVRRPYCCNMALLSIVKIWITLRPPKFKHLSAHGIAPILIGEDQYDKVWFCIIHNLISYQI